MNVEPRVSVEHVKREFQPYLDRVERLHIQNEDSLEVRIHKQSAAYWRMRGAIVEDKITKLKEKYGNPTRPNNVGECALFLPRCGASIVLLFARAVVRLGAAMVGVLSGEFHSSFNASGKKLQKAIIEHYELVEEALTNLPEAIRAHLGDDGTVTRGDLRNLRIALRDFKRDNVRGLVDAAQVLAHRAGTWNMPPPDLSSRALENILDELCDEVTELCLEMAELPQPAII